jgi:hypothetical protein
MKTVSLFAACTLLAVAASASAQTAAPQGKVRAVVPIDSICPARIQELATYETIKDVPSPFEALPLPKPLSESEDLQMRVARAGATGSTIIQIAASEQNEQEKKAVLDGLLTIVYRTQPVRVFADTTRINAACRVTK